MKINEFIEKVNEVAYAECNHGTIFIYSRKVPVTQMRDWFLCLDPQEQNFHYGYDWESIDLTPGNLFKLVDLIQKFRLTPVNERFPEREFYLVVGRNDYGKEIYLTKIDGPIKIATTLNKDCLSTWNEKELKELENTFPNLAPAIKEMKKEAKDDE
ncbi:hypothetical protein [Limosilactobacillus reuteri]|jgi:hypothetical protein|uniref:Uncharacterized protein n=2 Tax=Limosilactobacillus reuteri TaxID=1598 RepID=S5NEP8_LIMRT|nr:hypothetical protein [Limosilactobacillus reuteri]AGR65279.1 hypothetical protein N134_06335 [Limosilactobacillus reuteri TD1]MCC4358526.1 hypothetical protein [Limosilactobacillus reuteri]MCC4363191.1 hypothetical protein [Limosilactobacillus reuteri]MCC4365031.1 hypothetical protein [Limosilactobacillus reuteri]MCH5379974.1 hypothetical protein [Limosilactobacillus reuteri]